MLILKLEDELINKNSPCVSRNSARAVILKDQMVLMIYCRFYDDYSFPGGGQETNETILECLYREAKEEGGVEVKVIEQIALINEYRLWLHDTIDQNFHQESHFYLCECLHEEEAKFEDYEIAFGYEKAWISIDKAITHNKNLLVKAEAKRKEILTLNNFEINAEVLQEFKNFSNPYVLKREIHVLEYLKKEYLNEEI